MNKIVLIGRLVKDPELKTTNSGKAFCGFTLAVPKSYKSRSGETQVDFINCVAWEKVAENLSRYMKKGGQLGLVGNLSIRMIDDKNGGKKNITEVIAESIEFLSRPEEQQQGQGQASYGQNQNHQSSQNQQQDQEYDEFEITSADLPF